STCPSAFRVAWPWSQARASSRNAASSGVSSKSMSLVFCTFPGFGAPGVPFPGKVGLADSDDVLLVALGHQVAHDGTQFGRRPTVALVDVGAAAPVLGHGDLPAADLEGLTADVARLTAAEPHHEGRDVLGGHGVERAGLGLGHHVGEEV